MSVSRDNLNARSDFAVIAEAYCTLIESLQKGRPPQFYHRLESLLAHLHMAILPAAKGTPKKKHPEFEKFQMSYDQWKKVAAWIGTAVSTESSDLVVWHENLDSDNDVCMTRSAALWDDLAEIYRDLHNGLTLWKMGTAAAQAEAAWQWRFGYEHRWGTHLFDAMTTVHEARYQLNAD